MKAEIMKAIQEIYYKKEYDIFREKSKGTLPIIEQVRTICNEFGEIEDVYGEYGYPSIEWNIQVPTVQVENFVIQYVITLEISKIVNAFHISYSYSVKNSLPNRVYPTFDGYSNIPCTKRQKEFSERMNNVLVASKYIALSVAEMNEQIVTLPILYNEKSVEDIVIYDKGDVQSLLFGDILGLLD